MNDVMKIEYKGEFVHQVVFDDGTNGADIAPETLYDKICSKQAR
jgi:hypothetical protein